MLHIDINHYFCLLQLISFPPAIPQRSPEWLVFLHAAKTGGEMARGGTLPQRLKGRIKYVLGTCNVTHSAIAWCKTHSWHHPENPAIYPPTTKTETPTSSFYWYCVRLQKWRGGCCCCRGPEKGKRVYDLKSHQIIRVYGGKGKAITLTVKFSVI